MMNKLMLSCKKASELIDKSDEIKLTLMEKLRLSFHVAMCEGCKSYRKQSLFIYKVLNRKSKINPENITHLENNPLKTQIITKIESLSK